MITLQDIQDAALRLQGQVLDTPCVESRTLSQIVGAQVFLKFENLQFTASFKERGACNKLTLLTAEERAHGVVAMSAGNHAQGVAYHAQRLGLRAVIVMPRFTPGVKVERTRNASQLRADWHFFRWEFGSAFFDDPWEAAPSAAWRQHEVSRLRQQGCQLLGQGAGRVQAGDRQ